MSGLARLLIRVFFSGVEVEHGERLGSDRPTVLVADHRNGLVDGLLLMASLDRYPRFLGKSTLFRNPLLWPFLHVGGVVPIYRAQEGGSPEGNHRAFERCRALLGAGGMVAVFPEGISHDEPALQPLRTGAARIALSALSGGVPEVDTVAVTLIYDDKQRFRSRALVRVGVPRPASRWMEEYRLDETGAVRSLTEDLADRLRAEGSEYSSWAEAQVLADIADVVCRPATTLPAPVDLTDRNRIASALAEARRTVALRTDGAAALDALDAAYASYRQALDVLGLDDAQVAADFDSGRLRWDLARAAAKVVAALPFAVVGVAVHAVPYGVVKLAGGVPDNVGMRSTVKVLGSLVLYAVTYAVVGVAVGTSFGVGPGLAAAVAAPACGYLALRMIERLHRVGGSVAGYRAFRTGGRPSRMVRSRRALVVATARSVLDPGVVPGP
jgi:1-acyl-sn-glycerol-3-phosphate acyltransferase